ncbi:complement receptor type 2-like [Chanodichthys erythropterus]|uniref:complement receptor type 2-like n=1 Tax=Chanodichthys erythropterus TaxID=933992 RepID=UPI00351EC292
MQMSVNMAIVWGNALILVFVHFVVSQRHYQCGEPTKYLDKQLDNKYLHKSLFNDGEKVAYKCFPGYSQSGGSRISRCTKGRWTLLDMICQKKKCNALGDIENGQYSQEGRSFGDKAIAMCNKGYVLRGGRVRMCVESGWNGTDPICEVSKIICSAPDVANRWIKPEERTQYTVQDTVTITCSEGFDLIGSSVVTCGPDGQWLNLPECRPKVQFSRVLVQHPIIKTCPTPELGKSGTVKELKSVYVPGDPLSVTCNEGFIGSGDFMCDTNEKWIPNEPKCQMIKCSAPTVANGRIRGSRVLYKYRDIVDVRCNEGFDLIGPPQITCGPDGQWQGLSECRPKRISDTGKCGPAPSHPNFELRDWSPTLEEYPSGSRIRYKCVIGHRRARGSDSIRCQGGQWTKLKLHCERKKCGSAGEISYGRFEYTGVSFGHTAKAICQEGYELVGPQMRTCRDGGWDGRNPTCEPVHCPPPPEVKGAEMFDPVYEHVPFGHTVSYHCRTGTMIGARDIYCTQKGTWSAPPPECKDIACPHPYVPRGSRIRGLRSVYKFGNTVTIACDPGLILIGQSFITCGPDGEWKPKLPECEQRDIRFN